jgi:hypothetical protein
MLLHRLAALLHKSSTGLCTESPVGTVWDELLADACVPPAPRPGSMRGWSGPAQAEAWCARRGCGQRACGRVAPPSMGRSSLWKLASGSGPKRVRLSRRAPRRALAFWPNQTPSASLRSGLPVGRQSHLRRGDEEHHRPTLRPQRRVRSQNPSFCTAVGIHQLDTRNGA